MPEKPSQRRQCTKFQALKQQFTDIRIPSNDAVSIRSAYKRAQPTCIYLHNDHVLNFLILSQMKNGTLYKLNLKWQFSFTDQYQKIEEECKATTDAQLLLEHKQYYQQTTLQGICFAFQRCSAGVANSAQNPLGYLTLAEVPVETSASMQQRVWCNTSAEGTRHFALHAHRALLVAVCSFGKGGDGSVPSCASLPSHPLVPFHVLAGAELHLGQSDVQ